MMSTSKSTLSYFCSKTVDPLPIRLIHHCQELKPGGTFRVIRRGS